MLRSGTCGLCVRNREIDIDWICVENELPCSHTLESIKLLKHYDWLMRRLE